MSQLGLQTSVRRSRVHHANVVVVSITRRASKTRAGQFCECESDCKASSAALSSGPPASMEQGFPRLIHGSQFAGANWGCLSHRIGNYIFPIGTNRYAAVMQSPLTGVDA